MNKFNITVLMATYNGEKYIKEQIDSILKQKEVIVNLLVRDDGSKDSTIEILKEYKSKGLLDFYTGENLGPQLGFMYLLQHAPDNDYYAFADQDDFWFEDKLVTAIKMIEHNNHIPSLYLSQTQLTDEHLNPKQSVIVNPLNTFGESLIFKFAGGCTMVLNHKLRERISDKIPSVMPMHDIWIYTFAHAINAFVVFDKMPHIFYRQHSNNAVGQGQGFVYEWKQRFHRLISQTDERYTQALELKNCYSEFIPKNNLDLLNEFLNGKKQFCKRLELIFNKDLRCSDKTTQILFWVNLLLNKY